MPKVVFSETAVMVFSLGLEYIIKGAEETGHWVGQAVGHHNKIYVNRALSAGIQVWSGAVSREMHAKMNPFLHWLQNPGWSETMMVALLMVIIWPLHLREQQRKNAVSCEFFEKCHMWKDRKAVESRHHGWNIYQAAHSITWEAAKYLSVGLLRQHP